MHAYVCQFPSYFYTKIRFGSVQNMCVFAFLYYKINVKKIIPASYEEEEEEEQSTHQSAIQLCSS